MLITTGGVLIRTRVSEIREMSRATQGVTLINLGPDEKLAGLQKIVDSENGAVELDADNNERAAEDAQGDGSTDAAASDGHTPSGPDDN